MPDDNRAQLLIIDDEEQVRDVLLGVLSKTYRCVAVKSAEEALALLARMRFDLMISDIGLTGMSGLDLVPRVLKIAPETVIIMISAAHTIESAIDSLRAGAFDYLTKPFDLRHVEFTVERALEYRGLIYAKRCYETYLEELIEQRTSELNHTLDTLEATYRATLEALVTALETRDADTHGHSERVVAFSTRLGQELALDRDELRALEYGALLHDIGKIGIPDSILRKPEPLSEKEWRIMRIHPSLGEKILTGIGFLSGAVHVVGEHHEKWDGSGYPAGLSGTDIDFKARIFAVADAFDAMMSDRVYRCGAPYELAAAELDRCAGTHFDPTVVDAFHRVPRDEWRNMKNGLNTPGTITRSQANDPGHVRSAGALLSDLDITSDWIRKLQQIVYVGRGHIVSHSGF